MKDTEIIIKPAHRLSFKLHELWEHRELFYFFTWRDIKVKYKQTFLGVAWALLQPLAMMLIFTYIFSKTLHIHVGEIPYPVFVLAGLVLWNFFNASVSNAGESMIGNAAIIRKIYFPRLIIPSSALLVALFDFVFAFIVFLGFCIGYKQHIALSAIIYFPAAIVIIALSAFGIGCFFAALNIKYRDFRYALPFVLQFWFFASQVVYPFASVQQPWLKTALAINPVNAAIELFRAPLLKHPLDSNLVITGLITTLLAAVCGLIYFRKTESYFADIA
jgi:lipopolysaccharide transport system permease protein